MLKLITSGCEIILPFFISVLLVVADVIFNIWTIAEVDLRLSHLFFLTEIAGDLQY